MIVALDVNNTRTLAREAQRNEEYCCPICGGEVILRAGVTNVAHFAHKKSEGCVGSVAKSALHHKIQILLYESLMANEHFEEACLEKIFNEGRIADVYAKAKGIQCVFEIQTSRISAEEARARVYDYKKLNCCVFFILYSPYRSNRRGGGKKIFLANHGTFHYKLGITERLLYAEDKCELLYVHRNNLNRFFSYRFNIDGEIASIAEAKSIYADKCLPIKAGNEIVLKEASRYGFVLQRRKNMLNRLVEILPPYTDRCEKNKQVLERYNKHISCEGGLNGVDFALEKTIEGVYKKEKYSFIEGVLGCVRTQLFWRSAVFHNFIHRKGNFTAYDVMRFLRENFLVNEDFLFRDVVGVLEAFRHLGVLMRITEGRQIRYCERKRFR